jgi:DNA-binding FrmR family transcriptional regulator
MLYYNESLNQGFMAHIVKDRKKLLDRVRRIRGQVDAIEKALLSSQECGAVLHNIAACRGAMTSLMSEVVEGHIRSHIMTRDKAQSEASEDLIEVIHSYVR